MICQDDYPQDESVAWVGTVYQDWTILQLANGDAFGFNRETGRVFKLPNESCPFLIVSGFGFAKRKLDQQP